MDPDNVDSVVKGINSDIKTFHKVKKEELIRLHSIKDVSHLAEEDPGPACQEDLKTLHNYMVKIDSRCTEVHS